MRALVALALAASMPLMAGLAYADETRPAFPAFDIDAFCHTQADYSFAATLGDSSFDRVLAACLANERDARDAAASLWRVAPAKALAECSDLAEGRYTHLARCLDGGGMRTAR